MTTPVTPMSAHEAVMFLSRVYSDLSVADGFVGITPEQIMQEKASQALASHLAYVREKMKPHESYVVGNSEMGEIVKVNAGVRTCLAVLQSEIDELTK